MITASVDMRSSFHSVREQGDRQSCLAFASSAAHEFQTNFPDYMSVEYLFYHAVQKTSHRNPQLGLHFSHITDALGNDGQPTELQWPYNIVQPPISQWHPPVITGAIGRSIMQPIVPDFSTVQASIDARIPVILGFQISDAFFKPDSLGTVLDLINDTDRVRHAVLGIGLGKNVVGAKYILIRNSWGETWGLDGYAWISEEYTSKHLLMAARLI